MEVRRFCSSSSESSEDHPSHVQPSQTLSKRKRNPRESMLGMGTELEEEKRLHLFNKKAQKGEEETKNLSTILRAKKKSRQEKTKESTLQKTIRSSSSESALSQDLKSDLLKCSVCYVDDYQKASLCRFCGNSACSKCWSNILSCDSKCPFCRIPLGQFDLVKDLKIDQIRQKKSKHNGSVVKNLNKECYDHEDEGKLFCVSCSRFLCLECITSGTHTKHKICDIHEYPKLKKKVEDIQTFCKKLREGTKNFEKVVSKHEEFFDTNPEDLKQAIKDIKDKVMARLTQNGDALITKLTLGHSLNAAAKDQCGKLKLIQRKIAKRSLKTIEVEHLRQVFNKQSKVYQAPRISEFVKDKMLTKNDMKELFALNIDYTNKAKFSEIIVSEFKQGVGELLS
ncbi:unnamed protein product [Moneuplotes crassus]|uniref:Uncharacterized protein n=1 Tax=Euplotes crassus TaxID=5936 RepID=A0AAD1XB97_EUPCR|nr:unnamed protein product [Moneuplotes crassus]